MSDCNVFESGAADIFGSPVSDSGIGVTRSMEALGETLGTGLDGFHLELGVAKGTCVRSSCMRHNGHPAPDIGE